MENFVAEAEKWDDGAIIQVGNQKVAYCWDTHHVWIETSLLALFLHCQAFDHAMSTHRVKDAPPSMSKVPCPASHESSNWVHPERHSSSQGTTQQSPAPLPQMPIPPVPAGGVEDEALNDLLMAWYYRYVVRTFSRSLYHWDKNSLFALFSGYYTGRYQATLEYRRQQEQEQEAFIWQQQQHEQQKQHQQQGYTPSGR